MLSIENFNFEVFDSFVDNYNYITIMFNSRDFKYGGDYISLNFESKKVDEIYVCHFSFTRNYVFEGITELNSDMFIVEEEPNENLVMSLFYQSLENYEDY